MPDEQQQEEPRVFEITTTAQVERTYRVLGADDSQAHERLRNFLKDQDSLREGLVTLDESRTTDTTPQRVKEKKEVTKPRAVEDRPVAERPEEKKSTRSKSA